MDKQLEFQIRYLSAQIEEAQQQLGETQLVLREVGEALMALAELEAKPKSTLVSIGASTFTHAKIGGGGKAVMPIGSNVFVSKSLSEVRKSLEQRGEKIAEALSAMEKNLSQLLHLRQELLKKAQAQQ